MTEPIQAELYTQKFDAYPKELLDFAAEHKLELPSLSTHRGQGLALLAQPENRGVRHVDPELAGKFLGALDMKSRDPIQAFNKATGIKRLPLKRGFYCLQFPFECDRIDLDKRVNATISGDKETQVNLIKTWFKKNIVDVPLDQWQIGHLDPTIGDTSEKNLAYQPPIQARYRNRFKWDAFFQKMWPTAKELIPKFDAYYTEAEQRLLLAALTKKFKV
jgi:hypothetical protein